jgi:RHH-type proline utilization regulon transcriptional repressor/proline dehydrogenase/delta 1-pyrroline-5-carboxylate dehydrogenase
VDAVSSLTVGYPADPTTQMGPIIEPAKGKLLGGLTTLGEGETWLVEPKRLDESGALWSPGVRAGVRRGSEYHLTEYFGPILGIMTASTLDEAISMQNEIAYGLTAGLHSLDKAELGVWLSRIQAGNLYVNRGTTGAIVRRQPFGGWKKSVVGPGSKAGGPNYLLGLGSWRTAVSHADAAVANASVRRLVDAAATELSADDFGSVRRAVASDAAAWANEFGTARDVSGLSAERNVFRYLPRPVTVRFGTEASDASVVRVLAAAFVSGAPIEVSAAVALPAGLRAAVAECGLSIRIESDEAWLARAGAMSDATIRLVGGSARELAVATNGRPDLAVYAGEVTEAGRIELLPFVHEQAVSITAHRFGTPFPLSEGLL